MAKEDLNKSQSVADPDLNNADPVNQQDLGNDLVNQAQTDGTLADGTDKDKTVKYSDLKKATDRATQAEVDAAHAQRQLELLQANVQGQQQAQQPQTKQAGSTYEQAMIDLNLTAEDLYGENMIKVQNRKAQLDAAVSQQQSAIMTSQQFMANHPDINQVVGSVNPATGQILVPSAELLAIVSEKPYLAQATLPAIYDAVVQNQKLTEFEKKAAAEKEHLERQNVDVNSLPLGASAAGGGGAGDVQNQQMMSREAVAEIEGRIERGETIE